MDDLDTRNSALLPPEQLKGMGEAATLLADAIAARQRLLIVADYDCDGATACAVGLRALRLMGATVDYLVPDRFDATATACRRKWCNSPRRTKAGPHHHRRQRHRQRRRRRRGSSGSASPR
jgi:DNA polymerase III psi subunit